MIAMASDASVVGQWNKTMRWQVREENQEPGDAVMRGKLAEAQGTQDQVFLIDCGVECKSIEIERRLVHFLQLLRARPHDLMTTTRTSA
jgi:hypothetical protein